MSGTSVQFERTHCSDQVGIYIIPVSASDLTITDLTVIYDKDKNEIGTTLTINNIGKTNTGPLNVVYFLTKEQIENPMQMNAEDYSLTIDTINDLKAGESRSSKKMKILSLNNIPDGFYWLGVFVDYKNDENSIVSYSDEIITVNSGQYGDFEANLVTSTPTDFPVIDSQVTPEPTKDQFSRSNYFAKDDSGWSISVNYNGPWHYEYSLGEGTGYSSPIGDSYEFGNERVKIPLEYPVDFRVNAWIVGNGDGREEFSYLLSLYYGSTLIKTTPFPLKGTGSVGFIAESYETSPENAYVSGHEWGVAQWGCSWDVDSDCRPSYDK